MYFIASEGWKGDRIRDRPPAKGARIGKGKSGDDRSSHRTLFRHPHLILFEMKLVALPTRYHISSRLHRGGERVLAVSPTAAQIRNVLQSSFKELSRVMHGQRRGLVAAEKQQLTAQRPPV